VTDEGQEAGEVLCDCAVETGDVVAIEEDSDVICADVDEDAEQLVQRGEGVAGNVADGL
jgi:hypothetical protein